MEGQTITPPRASSTKAATSAQWWRIGQAALALLLEEDDGIARGDDGRFTLTRAEASEIIDRLEAATSTATTDLPF